MTRLPPVKIRRRKTIRSREPDLSRTLEERTGYAWDIEHNGELVASFPNGERALAHVNNGIREWEATQPKPVNWAPVLGLLVKAIGAAAKRTSDG